HAPDEQVAHAELLADLLWTLRGLAVLRGARRADHLDARQAGELAAHGVRHAVGEIRVTRVANVLEWEHRESDRARLARRRALRVRAPREERTTADRESENERERGRRNSAPG